MKEEIKKLKKTIFVIITICCVLVASIEVTPRITAEAATYGQNDIYKYQINGDGTIKIVDYFGADESLVIPEEIDGYTVVSIMFTSSKPSVKRITLPSTLIDFSKSLSVFYQLEYIYVDENNTMFSCENGFLYNKDKTELLEVPSMYQAKDGKIEISDSVVSVSVYVHLFKVQSMKTLYIGANVQTGPFSGDCLGNGILENIYVSDNNKYYTSVDGVLYSKDMTELLSYPEKNSAECYVVPTSVMSIPTWTFSKDYSSDWSLKNVILPTGVSLGINVFYLSDKYGFGPNKEINIYFAEGSDCESYFESTDKDDLNNLIKHIYLVALEVDSLPLKSLYNQGEELVLTGLSLNLNAEDGSIFNVSDLDCRISGYDATKVGKQVISVAYGSLSTVFEITVAAPIIKGDATLNNVIDIYDILAIQRHILGTLALNEKALTAADVSGNSTVDVFDILAIQRHILGVEIIG
ncbi:dockerin type I domain-containing protein [[Clostridium] fimetarium]|uniref:Ig-like domain (Group 3) n=1 Tax=[Clostridium] fimetarium TaxID=99656 RepID=A0A1I0MDN2_9FIRM|nr:dockerin type I domain-containing protein [[Clostridium] fimetarium]SEV85846.1 Ig-like domain (group 3) [[Clostridium] fimetarium]